MPSTFAISTFASTGLFLTHRTFGTDAEEFGFDIRPETGVGVAMTYDEGEDETTFTVFAGDLSTVATFTADDVAHHGITAIRPDADEVAYITVVDDDVIIKTVNFSGVEQNTTKIAELPYDISQLILGYDPFEQLIVSGPTWEGPDGEQTITWVISTEDGEIVFTVEEGESQGFTYTLPFLTVLGSTRETSLTVVANGDIKLIRDNELITPTGGTGAMVTDPYAVHATFLYGRVFLVDGTNFKVLGLEDDTVTDMEATAPGEIPEGARLIARYRGRLVISGIASDPHNWFMSALGDPFDWDFAPPTVTATQAVAGNLSDAGEIGDVITTLIPYSDDIMIFGCDNSIWLMANDPAAGGSIDLVTDRIGMSWGASWTKDPNGVLYFVGTDGVYRMTPGSLPESVTLGRLDEEFRDNNLSTQRVLIAWDTKRKGLVVTYGNTSFAVPQRSFFYDARADAWTEERYIPFMGPTALFGNDSDDPLERTLLLGGKDGFLREFSEADADDDGEPVNSRVRFPVVQAGTQDQNVVLVGLRLSLGEGSSDVTARVFAGATAEQCVDSTTPRVVREFTEGNNMKWLPRIRAPFIQVELENSGGPWAVEAAEALVVRGGTKRRKRH